MSLSGSAVLPGRSAREAAGGASGRAGALLGFTVAATVVAVV